MPSFGAGSLAERATIHPDLQKVLDAAIVLYNFKITEGFRGEAAQHADFLNHKSEVDWPNGKHNSTPSKAADIYPWPVDWSDAEKNVQRSVLLAGIVLATAHQLGIKVRWGGDWNQDGDTRDEKFRDYGHFELA